jgi:hypothetical protein
LIRAIRTNVEFIHKANIKKVFLKNNTMIKKIMFAFILILLICCNVKETYLNEHIRSDIRSIIKLKNDKVIEAINQNKPEELIELFSDSLKKQADSSVYRLVDFYHKKSLFQSYKILDEYYSNSTSLENSAQIKSNKSKYNYTITYDVQNNETYISLLLIEVEHGTLLATCIYSKYANEWKMTKFHIGQYAILNNTAIDFYIQAKKNYTNGNLVDATLDLSMLSQLIHPASHSFNYKEDDEIKIFYEKVMNEAKKSYSFPIPISAIKTQPKIYFISSFVKDDGIYPEISYVSQINLADTVRLKDENNELQNNISKILNISQAKKYIFFLAYNDIPNGRDSVKYYRFVGEVK